MRYDGKMKRRLSLADVIPMRNTNWLILETAQYNTMCK